MSYQHDLLIENLAPITHCIAEDCTNKLTDVEIRKRMIFCNNCMPSVIEETAGAIISKHGVEGLKNLQIKTHVSKNTKDNLSRHFPKNILPSSQKRRDRIEKNRASGSGHLRNNRPL